MLAVIAFTFANLSAFAADKPLEGAIIVVDPGHGGQSYSKSYTGGTRGVTSKLTESELNLRVGLELAKILKEDGATVFTTRVADHRLSREGSASADELHARIDFFEHHECHFWVSVHHNAADSEKATGHTAIYKHNAKDDTLYEAIAREVNDSLASAVPGPKRKLIKSDYHLTRETSIPGTISEAGFLTNTAYDKQANDPNYPQQEALSIATGLRIYWLTHHEALKKLREELIKERAKAPRDPKSYTATALNPEYREQITQIVKGVAPTGKYEIAKAGAYFAELHKLLPDSKDELTVTSDGKTVKIAGKVVDRKLHDLFIDVLVEMKLYSITNTCTVPKRKAAVESP